jgi:hypothetical protein
MSAASGRTNREKNNGPRNEQADPQKPNNSDETRKQGFYSSRSFNTHTHTPKQAARTRFNKEKSCWIKWPLRNKEKNSAESLPYRTAERQKNARETDDVSAKIYWNLLKQTYRAQEKGFETPKESSRNRSNHTHQNNSPNQSSTRFSYIHKWDPQTKTTRKLARYSTVQDTVTMGRKMRRKGARKGYWRDRGRTRASD